jgi:hypothetical protein
MKVKHMLTNRGAGRVRPKCEALDVKNEQQKREMQDLADRQKTETDVQAETELKRGWIR